MDRRWLVTSAVVSGGFLVIAGVASALPVMPVERVAPQNPSTQNPVENVWWRRRRWRRRHWRRW